MIEFETGTLYEGDCIEVLKTLPENSIQCCVTSPPYYGLRDYGVDGQLGLEETPEEYVSKMVAIFREVRRVLRDNGVLFLNLGDSYAANSKGSGGMNSKQPTNAGSFYKSLFDLRTSGLKPKDLIGIPWRVAFALQADGWWLRQDIIWHKPNPMPESVTDRCTKAHEYIFLMTKSARYFYDNEAIKEPFADDRMGDPGTARKPERIGMTYGDKKAQLGLQKPMNHLTGGRNKRSVWTVTTKPFSGAHFAVFPPKLIEPCILAGTSEKGCCSECGAPLERVVENGNDGTRKPGSQRAVSMGHSANRMTAIMRAGEPMTKTTTHWQPTCDCNAETKPCTVLDPFAGSGTTCIVSIEHGRHFIGIELNPEYIEIARRRIQFAETAHRQQELFN